MSLGTVLRDLTAEVEIPENGTLSRVLYRDEHIRLVVFAFDQGQELTDHTAGVPVTIQLVRGKLALRLESDEQEIGPASWVHLPAGLTHAVKALEPSVMVLTLLRSAG
jgi:quercetin dioxygenase-like cupin family protein